MWISLVSGYRLKPFYSRVLGVQFVVLLMHCSCFVDKKGAPMDKIGCMRAFVAVVVDEGFSSAARKTGQSKALMSKYVAYLEGELGVRLLNRTTRRVTLTADGQAYYERCLILLDDLDELEASLQSRHSQPGGELRVSAPVSFAELKLVPLLSGFLRQFPDVTVQLQLSDRMVDMVDEGIDVAIRVADLPDSSLVARKLASVRIIACAAPSYLQQRGMAKHPLELSHHACILDSNLPNPRRWDFMDQGRMMQIPVSGPLAVNSATAVRGLAIQGHGIALCPDFVVQEDMVSGRLVSLLEAYEPRRHSLYAVYPHRRHLSAKVRCFIDFLVAEMPD
jgi:DNA-binding transcriptional LysR family regulator